MRAALDKIDESSDQKNKPAPGRERNQTALVAGGAGFIGSHLVKTLISQNFHVVCVDNLSTGKKENLKDVLTSPNLTFIQEDINNPNFRLPAEMKIDYCFHLASSEDYAESEEFSLDTLLVNSLGTRQLLEIARQNQAKFILLSAADLYSGAISSSSLRFYFGKSPEKETILSLHEAKRFAEALTFEYYKKFDLPVTIIRLKDVYGPKMNFDRGDTISGLIHSAIKREKLKIYGDGLETLNPTYVSDIIFSLIKASVGDFSGEIFILVNPEKVTVESFAQTLKLVSGPLEIEHKKTDENLELPFTHLDLDNTKEKIGWNPKVGLAEGLSGIIQSERIEKVSQDSQEIKPLEIVESEKPELPKAAPSVKTKSVWSKPLRIGIFVFSLLLLLITVVYPISMTAWSSIQGRSELQQAADSLGAEKTSDALTKALSAQNSFESAASNQQNISWLFKIVGLGPRSANFDHLLQASADLSQAIRSSAKANELLISAASRDDLGNQEALDTFNKVLTNLYAGRDKLEQTQLLLDSIDWNQVPPWVAPEKDFMLAKVKSLQKEVNDLISTVEERL